MSTQSTPDLFIEAMSRLRELDRYTDNDEPMRHQIRSIRDAAMQGIDNACRQAINLSWAGRDLSKESKQIVADALAAATPSPKESAQ